MPQMSVLVVDDVRDWQSTLSGLLSDEGYQVSAVGDRKSALEAIKAGKFGLAIIDIRLDETDEDNTAGLNLASEIKSILVNLPVILITGYETKDTVTRALKPDATGQPLAVSFVRKTDVFELVDTVNGILASSGPVPKLKPAVTAQPASEFKSISDCNLTISLEPRQVVLIRAGGCITFAHTSRKLLDLDTLRFARRGVDLWSSSSQRFNLKEIGRDLHRLLFLEHPIVLRGYYRALGKVSRADRLHLVFESTRDFIGVPLELLFSGLVT